MSKLQSFHDLKTPFYDAWNVFLQQNPSHDDITKAFFTPYNLTHLNGGNIDMQKIEFLQNMIQERAYQAPQQWNDTSLHISKISKLLLCCLFKTPYARETHEINMADRRLVEQARQLHATLSQHEKGLTFLHELIHGSRNNEAVFGISSR